MRPYQVIKDLEHELESYTGAPYVVCVSSCSVALQLALRWHWRPLTDVTVIIPKMTYVSVPASVKNAGFKVGWKDESWRGAYQLEPLPVWDCARRFTSGMYRAGQYQCVSFASSKILGIEQGGAILHDNSAADIWFRKMRFDGRTEGLNPKDDYFDVCGYHCPMLPSIAAQLLLKLSFLPKHNEDLPYYDYPDLSQHPAFQ